MIGFLDQVVARLMANCPRVLQAIPAPDAEAIAQMELSAHAVTAVVTPLSDTAIPPGEAGFRVSQTTVERFAVVLALAFPGGFPEFEPARDEIKAALRGWLLPEAATPVLYTGGRLIDFDPKDGGRWLHSLEFSLTHQDTYEHQS